MSDLSNWEDIGQHLFDRYCIEGEDEDFCILAEKHDKEVIQNYIDKVVEELAEDDSIRLMGSCNSNNYMIPLSRAIEIVRQVELNE